MVKYMTRQEMLDRVAEKLIPQGARCTADFAGIYLDPETEHRCAAGWCIPDDIIRRLEDDGHNRGTSVEDLLEKYGSEALGWDPTDSNFLTQLQAIHDHCEPMEWDEKYAQLARNYDLEWRPTT